MALWSLEESIQKAIALYQTGVSLDKSAMRFGIGKQRLKSALQDQHIRIRDPGLSNERFSASDMKCALVNKKLESDLNAKLSVVCKTVGVHMQTFNGWCKRNGVDHSGRRVKANPNIVSNARTTTNESPSL